MRKFSIVLVFLMTVVLLLSVCGGAAAPAAPEAAEGDTVAEAPAEAADPNAEPTPILNAFGECEDPLILWHGLTGTDGAVFATMLEQFVDATPDACVSSEAIFCGYFFQKYPTAVAAGTPPDMVIFHAAEVNQMANQGLMMPLDELVFTDGTLNKDDFNPAVMDAISVDGRTMAVPFDNHGWMLWYNEQLIEEAGLDPNALPQNGDEFIEWAQMLTTDVNGLHPNEEGFDPENVDVWAMEFTWPRVDHSDDALAIWRQHYE